METGLALRERVDQTAALAKFEVTTSEQLRQASEYRDALHNLRREIENAFDATIHKAYEAHREAVAAKRRYTDPIDRADGALRSAMSGFIARQRQLAAASAEQARDDPFASAALVRSPQADGVATREDWDYRVIDPAQVPREFLVVDAAKLRQRVRRLKAFANIPGIEVFRVDRVVRKSPSAA